VVSVVDASAEDAWGEFERGLVAATRGVRLLAAMTPTNLREERGRLVRELSRSGSVVPRFTYAPADRGELRGALARLARRAAAAVPARLARLYLARIEELELEARVVEAVGTGRLGALAEARFTKPPDAALELRERELVAAWLALPREGPSARTPSDASVPGSLLSALRREVGARRLPFAVEASATLQSRAATGERTIWVARGRPLTAEETRRTVLHEIDGHVMPRVRARSLSPIFSIGTARGTDDQEGLALVLEERASAMTASRRRELAARHRAAWEMRGGASFHDVARGLTREGGLGFDEAIDVAQRVFRGSAGSGPGLGRELVYLRSWLEVGAHLARRPDEERVLGSGQVSVASLRDLPPPS
jgi:hypothetical protein